MNKLPTIKLTGYVKIEFWIVTGCIIIAFLLSFLSFVEGFNADQHLNTQQIARQSVPLLFSYLVVFMLYLSLCFYLSPAFESEDGTVAKSTPVILFFLSICYLAGVVNMYFAALLALKMLFLYFKRNAENKENASYYEAAFLIASWILLSLIVSIYMSAPLLFKFYMLFDVLMGILGFLYGLYVLCPRALKKYPRVYYWCRMFLFAILSTMAVSLICFGFKYGAVEFRPTGTLSISIGDESNIGVIAALNFFTQLLIIAPIARIIYKNRTGKAS